jgi:hypothetical protein
MNITTYIAEKRAILEAATPGHWLTFDEDGMYSGEIHVVDDDDGGPRTAMHHITCEPEGDDHADDRAALVDSMNHRQAEIEALAELWDALEKVLPWLEREVGPQYAGVGSDGLPIERESEPREEACGMSAMALRAALHHAAARLG